MNIEKTIFEDGVEALAGPLTDHILRNPKVAEVLIRRALRASYSLGEASGATDMADMLRRYREFQAGTRLSWFYDE